MSQHTPDAWIERSDYDLPYGPLEDEPEYCRHGNCPDDCHVCGVEWTAARQLTYKPPGLRMDAPPMVCKRCGALTPALSPDARERGTLCSACIAGQTFDRILRTAFPSILQSEEDKRRKELNENDGN